jgi:uncharacterized protein YecE (DUF72 family)
MVRIRCGTSGWSYPAWRGRFYPEKLPATRFLAAYATRLPAVEVNATFHRMPRASTLEAWRAEVPSAFVFALKAPMRITHLARLAGIADPLAYFYRVAAELGPALGPVFFQLPPTMKKDLPRLADLLALVPRGARTALQLRDPTWFTDDVLQLVADRGAALVLSEDEDGVGPLLPTARFGYLRLRRPDYDDASLAAWAARIQAQPWDEAFLFFKHEDEARGPAFALRMTELAGDAGVAAPGAP